MELIDNPSSSSPPSSSSSSSSNEDEKIKPEDLLEQSWFFGNLLDKSTKMSRCYSDPCPSSMKKKNPGLLRAPSMPPCIAREEIILSQETENRTMVMSESIPQPLRNRLYRAPSLPLCIGRRDDVDIENDPESEFSMGKLIRQASLKSAADILPPRHSSNLKENMIQISSVPRHPPLKKPELERIKMEGYKEIRHKYLTNNQTKMRKSPSKLTSEEVQDFKDLGFKFAKQYLNPAVKNVLPDLQEKKKQQIGLNEDKVRRPHLSEAWLVVRSSEPRIPNWVEKRSPEDMKTHIKFWARAVASNVR